MKWITHQASAVTLATVLALPIPAIVGSLIGAVIPDQIDFFRCKFFAFGPEYIKRQRWNKIHRGFSHFWGLYVIMGFGLLFLAKVSLPELIRFLPMVSLGENIVMNFLFGFILGAFSHLLTDLLTPSGIPLYPSKNKDKRWKEHRISLNILSTNSLKEYLFLFAVLVILTVTVAYSPQSQELYKIISKFL